MIDPNRTCFGCMSSIPDETDVCPNCGARVRELKNAPNQLEIGSILAGRFLVGRTLGQGGFGITYIGYELHLDRRVAIKEYFPEGFVTREQTSRSTVFPIPGERGGFFEKGRSRFVEEARTLARFTEDAGIVSVYDYFMENGTAYIVMDFVEGSTLKTLARERGGRLPSSEVFAYLLPVMDSLEKVHAAGMLHRDISPDNIIIRPNGCAVLLDFGAARQISAMGEHSNTINVKHGFAPEEQYRTHGEQGPWSDIYAMCATIYRLTTGVTPPQAMDRAMSDLPLTPPNALGANMTEAQQAAVMKGLSVRGRDRQRSVAELKRGLNAKTAAVDEKLQTTTQKKHTVPDGTGTKTARTTVGKKARKAAWIATGMVALVLLGILLPRKGDAGKPAVVSAAGQGKTEAEPTAIEPTPTPNGISIEEFSRQYQFSSASDGYVITAYLGGDTDVTVPDYVAGTPVIGIGGTAFQRNNAVRTVCIPETVTHIADSAFAYNSGMMTVDIPKNVTSIAPGVFAGSTGVQLKIGKDNAHYLFENRMLLSRDKTVLHTYLGDVENFEIPSYVTSIHQKAFFGNVSLVGVTIPECVTSVGDEAFLGCMSLANVTLSEGVGSIGDSAFFNCTSLTAVIVPGTASSIGAHAFQNCSALANATLLEGVKDIGDSAFQGCTSLASIIVPGSAASIGDSAFRDCAALTNATLSEGVTTVGREAFSGCAGLKSIVMPKSLTRINEKAFYNCVKLNGFRLQEGITNIESQAFLGCNLLSSITIPASVTHLASDAFSGCGKLSAKVAQGNENYQLKYGVLYNHSMTEILAIFPAMVRNAYTVPNGVTKIPDGMFRDCVRLTRVNFSDSVEEIGDGAFEGCTALAVLMFTEAQTKIGEDAFRNCKALKRLEIPGSVRTIDGGAFYGCASLLTLQLEEGVEKIGAEAFAECKKLKTVIVPQSVDDLHAKSFRNCSSATVYTYSKYDADSLSDYGVKARAIDSCIERITLYIGKKTVIAYAVKLNQFSGFEWDQFKYSGNRVSLGYIETTPRILKGTLRNCYGMEYDIIPGEADYGWPYRVPWRGTVRLSSGGWSSGDVRKNVMLTPGERVSISVLFFKPSSIAAFAEEPANNPGHNWQAQGNTIYAPTLYFSNIPDAQAYLDSIG